MGDTKISLLPPLGTAPDTDDVFAIVDSGANATKSVTVANVKTSVAPDTATDGSEGVVELSTDDEAKTGTATNRVLTPANLQAVTGTETRKGVLELATTAEVDTGTDTARAVTAAGVKSANTGTFDIWVPAAAMRPATTNGCAAITDVETTALRPDLQVLDFDPDTDQFAQFSIAMPKSWDEGTITAQFYWTNAATVANDCVWGIQGVTVADAASIDVAYGTAVIVTSSYYSTAEFLAVSAATAAMTFAGTPAAGELAFLQVYRDATNVDDDLATDARLIGVKIIYTTDTITDA